MAHSITTLRIATRKSPLALAQANIIKEKLLSYYPNLSITLLPLSTAGDDSPHLLRELGGKGLFTKELEQALLDKKADIAVHSMKDMPTQLPDGFMIAAICDREDPRDVLFSQAACTLSALPKGSRVATASLRRQAQILNLRPDLDIVPMRGNLGTRLRKLEAGECDALVLAAAGLSRLNLWDTRVQPFTTEAMIPAVAQGALGIECLSDALAIQALIAPLHDEKTGKAVSAERAFNAKLNGGCRAPIAAYATSQNGRLELVGLVASPDGEIILKAKREGALDQAEAIGNALAEQLYLQGAKAILDAL